MNEQQEPSQSTFPAPSLLFDPPVWGSCQVNTARPVVFPACETPQHPQRKGSLKNKVCVFYHSLFYLYVSETNWKAQLSTWKGPLLPSPKGNTALATNTLHTSHKEWSRFQNFLLKRAEAYGKDSPLLSKRTVYQSCKQRQRCPRSTGGIRCAKWKQRATETRRSLQWANEKAKPTVATPCWCS